MQPGNLFFIFTDLQGYSDLDENEMIRFQTEVCTDLATHLAWFTDPKHHIAFNTWGDAIYAVFQDGVSAVKFALAYRDYFKQFKLGDKTLAPRIAGHFGQGNPVEDPLNNGRVNVFGQHVNTTARMEPVTRPGEIYVSDAFRRAYLNHPDSASLAIKFDELGILKLAKSFGELEVFRLRLASEPTQILDKLVKEDLSAYIPTIPVMSETEQKRWQDFDKLPSPDTFLAYLEACKKEKFGASLFIKLAEKANSFGLYDCCLTLLEQADSVKLEVNQEQVHAVPYLAEYKKIKANALTRLGRYKEAENLMFGLWHSGHKDADTLSMLAAQYKRRAIFGKTRTESVEVVDQKLLDKALLKRACKLYVEAFRQDISSYYSAINAAYLYMICGGKDAGKGRKLARYIGEAWRVPKEKNWWLAVALAEVEMLDGESDEALNKFKYAVTHHQPTIFQLNATLEQIIIYAKLSDAQEELQDILDYLKQQLAQLTL